MPADRNAPAPRPAARLPRSALLFVLVVAFGLAQVSWWTYFQFRETRQLDEAARLLHAGEVDAAARALGAADAEGLTSHARRRRIMFVSEGAFLSLCVLIGVVFFYTAMLRERRMRREQSRFLTGATHELKTPLATMRLGLEAMLDGRVPEGRQRKYLGDMLHETDRLERGVTNILTAAGLHEGQRLAHRTAGDLAEDVRAVVAELGPRAAAAGVGLESVALESLATTRDRDAIRLVAQNLLDNAIKYSREGDRVSVELRRDGEHAVLCVRDTGIGLSAGALARACEPFYRGDEHAHVGGSGLGLYLVRELVAAHGGRLQLRSEGPGKGTEVEVRLPLREVSP